MLGALGTVVIKRVKIVEYYFTQLSYYLFIRS